MKKGKSVLFCLCGLLIMLASSFSLLAEVQPVSLADDAYHFPAYNDGQHDLNYIEWWYFNFYDKEKDIQAIFSYGVNDPNDVSGFGQANLTVVVFTPQGSFHKIDLFPLGDYFGATTDQAEVSLGYGDYNTIKVVDEDTYHITGSMEGVAWDLSYTQAAKPWYGGDREKIGMFPWEQMSWLVFMPAARVTGQITVNGQTYNLENTPGYHDHNWGEWLPTSSKFNWAQYSEPDRIALEIGDFPLKQVGRVSFDYEGERVSFSQDQYTLFHTRWEFDRENRKFFPIQSWLIAENDTHRLIVRMDVRDTLPLTMGVPIAFLPYPIIYEQTAQYQGWLWEKNQWGKLRFRENFSGEGFKEYTALKVGEN